MNEIEELQKIVRENSETKKTSLKDLAIGYQKQVKMTTLFKKLFCF